MRIAVGEVRKLLTIRTPLWFALGSVVLAILNVVAVGLASGTLDEIGEKEEALGGMPMLLLFFGAVAVTAEFRHRTAAPTVLVSGTSSTTVTAVRLGATLVVGLAVAVLTTVAAFALGVPIVNGHHPGPDLTADHLVPLAAGCVLAGALSVLIGAALGALLRNQIAAVVAGIVVYFVAPPLVGTIDASAVDYTPSGSMQVLTRGVHGATHSFSESATALAAWAVGLTLIAILAESRRDLG
ncbi:ABC transporter permease [Mumia sp. ZJ1417]|uniref:ABC transporter permease n=1 Tax=Mumia sp. ZJ1417 TaxID=2708082 RepID=UPI00141E7E47|nr:ABC transporter permease [Mumia sp. ZJ1417]QMW65302.1 ABC transporter permease [Mumia sp. ZJ1417]